MRPTVEFDSPQSETEIDSWGTLWVHETKWKGMKGVTCWFFEGQYIVDSVNTDTKLATLHLVESRNSVPTNACQINSEFEISFENFKKLIRKTNLALSRSQVGMCAIIFYLK